MITYGLETFGISDATLLSNALAAIVSKRYPQEDRRSLGAMILSDTIDRLAQKIDALEDGFSNGYLVHPGIEADVLNALFDHGMSRKVKLVDGNLRRGD